VGLALSKRHSELKGVEFFHLHLEKHNPSVFSIGNNESWTDLLNSCSVPEYKDAFFTNNFFIGANQRKNVAQGISSYVPAFLQDVPKLMHKNILAPDWALLNVSPPDKHGFCSLGVEVFTSLDSIVSRLIRH
jgi:4-hydroxybutyrate CoA-transferase